LCGATVYTPEKIGNHDVLIGGTKILQLQPTGEHQWKDLPLAVVDVAGLTIIPGLVDPHVHATGGGGEKGPASRTPEAKLDQLIEAGITTLVGVLGTDSISRSLPNLLTKLRGLDEEGLSTFMWSGAYRVPPPLLTHSVQEDVMLIDKVIGFGEIAISDHRSSHPTFEELSRLVGDTRVAGLISGKAGKTHFHVGSGNEKLKLLFEIADRTPIPITQMYPTHINGRGPGLVEDGKKWLQAGGTLDLTCGKSAKSSCIKTLVEYDKAGVPLKGVTLSSDAYGSLPKFDKDGRLLSYDYSRPGVILNTVKILVKEMGWPLEKVLPLCTKNTGDFLSLKKGVIAPERDADILVVDDDFRIHYMFSRGQILKTPTWTKQPLFPL